jgi:hypothetical protein
LSMVQIAAVKHWGLPHESLKLASWTQYTRKHNNMVNSFYGSSNHSTVLVDVTVVNGL